MSTPATDYVLINMSTVNEWANGYENRNRHIVEHLCRQPDTRRILLVDYPPLVPRKIIRAFLDRAVSKPLGNVVVRDATSRIVHLDRTDLFPHGDVYQLSTIDSALSDGLLARRVRWAVTKLGIQSPILWSYVPLFGRIAGAAGERLFVFDAVDNWIDHPAYAALRGRLKRHYASIARSADCLFTVSDALHDLFVGARHVQTIQNGVDSKRFRSPQGNVPMDIAPLPDPVLIYTGILEQRFDADLVRAVAAAQPSWSFALIGPVWETASLRQLQRMPNIRLLGRKPYEQLPLYLREASLGIVPHRATALTKGMNPMKVYQYLAAGLPVVTTNVPGLPDDLPSVRTAATAPAFIEASRSLMADDSQEERTRRQDAMKSHDWTNVVETMLRKIRECGSQRD